MLSTQKNKKYKSRTKRNYDKSHKYSENTLQMTKQNVPEAFPNNTRIIPEEKKIQNLYIITYV